jgi:hypothetical protein
MCQFGSELRSTCKDLRIEPKQNGPRCVEVATTQTKGYKPTAGAKGGKRFPDNIPRSKFGRPMQLSGRRKPSRLKSWQRK